MDFSTTRKLLKSSVVRAEVFILVSLSDVVAIERDYNCYRHNQKIIKFNFRDARAERGEHHFF
jgi:hypothetical protein